MKNILFLFAAFILHTVNYAQKITLQVSNSETKEPVEFASILLPEYKKSFVTDENGIFIIDTNKYKLPLKVITEQLSFEKKETVLLNRTETYAISLNPSSELLQEIIIPPANAKIKERSFGRKGQGSGKIVGSFRNFDKENKNSGVEFGMILNTNNKLKKVKKIHWHINNSTFKQAIFGLQFYEVVNGKPGKKIPHAEINFVVGENKNGWLVLNIDDLDVYIDGNKKVAAVLKALKVEFKKNKKEGSLSLNVGFAAGNNLIGRDSQFEDWMKIPMNYPFYITVDSYE